MSKRCSHHGQCSCAWEAKEKDIDHGGTLYPFIDTDKVRGLNESKNGASKNVIKPWDERTDSKKVVRSTSGDGELIIHIPFTVQVKLKSFTVIGGDDGSAPNSVKLYKNRDDIDFETAEEVEADQEFNLTYDSDGSVQYPVKIFKFQNCSSITMFFTGNFDEETTQINYIGLKGEGTKNKRSIVVATYEARALESDHAKLTEQHASHSIQ
mmetsp:Transcript_20457/g.28545  ORF Transcript_20457/g.28545 Transcript_20457/m.28545 type:complete len:210 (-) Transcript_20457:354-983(-)|eukprot:CAMPEP_0184486114 /NCGR_PEP_ID=MMETSP0113_2-20130426/7666_1 /TAXON_ID=91329 /ORGANISM="Norrisiella sphaerica, Strain BC52" /LENGTH=209 /DNA_ID=CAMNT_0026867855 /DNA_START=57 /DNA_END=686 /DNA_ORIENTATION=-